MRHADEKKFALENAQSIFEMHIEGTFLYDMETNGGMPRKFIEKIVDSRTHAKRIKKIMYNNILKEVLAYPNTFTRDAQGFLVYDIEMYDYGFCIEDYCRKQFRKNLTKQVWVCTNCGSDEVQTKMWVDLNTGETNGSCSDGEADDNYCKHCEGHHLIEFRTVHVDWKFISQAVEN